MIESGCIDPDNDGILGTSPPKVDGLGLVVDSYIAKYDFTGNPYDELRKSSPWKCNWSSAY